MIKINKWSQLFENADTRKRQRLGWFLAPSGCDSRGYRQLMRKGKDGIVAFGVFQALCQVMATYSKETRASGEFRHSDGSGMEVADIWEITRMKVADDWQIIETLKEVGWSSLVTQQSATSVPPPCHPPATSVPDNSGIVKGEGKGEGKGKGKGEVFCPQVDDKQILSQLWELAPKLSRQRSSKMQVWDEWKKIKKPDQPTLEELLAAIDAWKQCDHWTKEDGEYQQGLHLWIKRMRWQDLPETSTTNTEGAGIYVAEL